MQSTNDYGFGNAATTFNAPSNHEAEGISISLDTEMIDEDEIMAMQAEGNDSEAEHGEIIEDPNAPQQPPPNMAMQKVHLRGLDNMSTSDVETFLKTNYSTKPHEKFEWINDTSLNIVFADESTAQEALSALSTESGAKELYWKLREAKRAESHPLARLEIRIATETDRKEKGARDRSRYYLFHPEAEREQSHRRDRSNDNRGRRGGREGFRERNYTDNYRDRSGGGDDDTDYNRRAYNAKEDSRRVARARPDELLYDDDDSVPAFAKKEPVELFPNGITGRKAARSVSPVELFPKGASGMRRPRSASPVELFPDRVKKPAATAIELFPEKIDQRKSSRRRSASPSNYLSKTPPRITFTRASVPSPPRRGQSPPSKQSAGVELFPEKVERRSNSRTNRKTPEVRTGGRAQPDSGFSIRGASGMSSNGFSIRGTAGAGQNQDNDMSMEDSPNAGVELLPGKASSGLFGRIEDAPNSRGKNRRRRAEDMFS